MDMMEVRGGGQHEWCGLLSCHIALSLAEVVEISNEKIRIIKKTYHKAQVTCQSASFGPWT